MSFQRSLNSLLSLFFALSSFTMLQIPTSIFIPLILGIITKMCSCSLEIQVKFTSHYDESWDFVSSPNITITSRGWNNRQLSVDRERRNGRVRSAGHEDGWPPEKIPNMEAVPRTANFACVVGIPGSALVLLMESLRLNQGSVLFLTPPLYDDCCCGVVWRPGHLIPTWISSEWSWHPANGRQAQFRLFLRHHHGFTFPSILVFLPIPFTGVHCKSPP